MVVPPGCWAPDLPDAQRRPLHPIFSHLNQTHCQPAVPVRRSSPSKSTDATQDVTAESPTTSLTVSTMNAIRDGLAASPERPSWTKQSSTRRDCPHDR